MLDEIKGEDLNFSQIFKGTAYIDPNDFGDIGYSFLPVALAAFREVVVYSPYPNSYKKATRVWPNSLSWQELESFTSSDGPLHVVARTSYLEKTELSECQDSFLKSVKVLDTSQWENNAEQALSFIQNDDARDMLRKELTPREISNLPPRYENIMQGEVEFLPLYEQPTPNKTRLPPSWQSNWNELSQDDKLRIVAQYDYLNDKIAMGKADRPFISLNALYIHKLTNQGYTVHPVQILERKLNDPDPFSLFHKVLSTAMPHFTSSQVEGQLTGNDIRKFRETEQEAFWNGVDDLFNEVLQAKPENRIETVQEWAKARERNMQLPGNIIMTIIPFLFVSWYSIPLALTVATGGRLVTPHLKDKPIMRRLGTLYCDSPIEKFLSPIFSSNSFSQLFKGLNKIWHFNNNL